MRQTLSTTPILYYLNSEYYFQIETDSSDYTMGEVSSQLTLDDLSQWHLVVFFFQKIISVKT